MFDIIQKKYDEIPFDFQHYANPEDELSYLFDEWVPYYRMKHAICRAINPASILEIGVRYGYSAISFLAAAPNATYLGIDNDSSSFGGSAGALEWAKKITSGYHAGFLVADTQKMTSLPGEFYDFIHIDGQQDGDGTIHDLTMALEKGRWILLDGYFWSKENMLSATYFLEKYRNFIDFFLVMPSYAGELLIKTKPGADHIFSGHHATYSALQGSYDDRYFLSDCGGFESFKRTRGKKLEDPRLLAVYCLAGPEKDKKILDIGCGRGELAFALASAGASVTGIDYSQAAIRIAATTFSLGGQRKNPEFIRADFLTWPVSEKYDVIIATDFIEHIEKTSLHHAMHKIAGLLQPDGIAIFHTAPNRNYYEKYYPQLKVQAQKIGSYLPKNPRTYYEDLMHINEQTPEELAALLNMHFRDGVVWVAGDNEMIGSLDTNYPQEKMMSARGIFAVASHVPVSTEKLLARLTQQPIEGKDLNMELRTEDRPSSVAVNQEFIVTVTLHNISNERIASLDPNPVHLSYHWLGKGGRINVFDGKRTQIMPPLSPGETRKFPVAVLAPSKEGEYTLQLTLVQESVFWFEEHLPGLPLLLNFYITAAKNE